MSASSPEASSSSVELPILNANDLRADASPPTIALVGNPNAGKTTLFNRLTGLRAQTANFPGTTVECRTGRLNLDGQIAKLIDLPGLYSLEPATPDERVACEALRGVVAGSRLPDVVLLVLDATNLERNLFLASQALELGLPVVAALSMVDLAEKHQIEIDASALSEELGCPVIATAARSGRGVAELTSALVDATRRRASPRPGEMLEACAGCTGCQYAARYDWAERVGAAAVRGTGEAHGQLTEKLDRWLTHRIGGLVSFASVMLLTFTLIFWVAQYPMEWIDLLFGAASSTVSGWLPAGDLRSLITDGLVGGVGGMLVFLPQICLLFFTLALLEDSGYLARAAFVMDRLMHRVGLPGKAFVPLLSAHACAIPAVMATRVIDDRRDRLATIFVIPLMTCSARIPVYAMVMALMFPHEPLTAALVFTSAYVLGIVAALGTAWLCKRTFLPGSTKPLVIELPHYRRPSLRNALLLTWDRATVFIKSAGTTILVISLAMWALATYPKTDRTEMPGEIQEQLTALEAAGDDAGAEVLEARVQLERSLIGRLGRGIEPIFQPLGFDWKMSVGVLSSFAAREVIVSTLAVLYGVGEDEASEQESLTERLRAARRGDGSPVFAAATCLSLLVFYTLAMQCLPTQAVVRRETGSWRMPIAQLVYMSLLAYVAALVVYQTASLVA
ncbi:MAG: ferrous iron transport protein B [Planctomycetales bacterium]|nr:ferrous iron transport protein B [Planctomycetales bacterium]